MEAPLPPAAHLGRFEQQNLGPWTVRSGAVVLVLLLVGVTTSLPTVPTIPAAALEVRTAQPITGLDAEAALRYLAQLPLSARQAIAPYLVEAAVANGRDATLWPPDRSAASMLTVTTNTTPFQQLLRPLYARQITNTVGGDPGLLVRVRNGFDGQQYGDPALDNDDAWALIALADDVPSREHRSAAATRLGEQQHADGGWSWSRGGKPDVDTTGMVATALQLTPPADTSPRLDPSVDWLMSMAATDAGFPSHPGGEPNCDSTVWGLRGMHALGRVPPAGPWRSLQSLQNPDGGYAYRPGRESNALCTAEVVTLIGLATHAGWLPREELATTTAKAVPGAGGASVPVLLMVVAGCFALASRRRRGLR